jgi:hypothetical protein
VKLLFHVGILQKKCSFCLIYSQQKRGVYTQLLCS